MKRLANIFLFGIAIAASAAMGYEIRVGEGTTAGASDFYVAPGGHNRLSLKYASIPFANLDATSEKSWAVRGGAVTAKTDGDGVVTVRFRDFLKAGPATLKFVGGHLRSLERNGDEAQKAKDLEALTTHPKKQPTLAQLWRKRTEEQEERNKASWWKDSSRLNLGYFNPNAAGTLFAEIAALLAALAIVLRKRGIRIVCAIGAVASLYALFLTGSRGSFISFLAGVALVALCGIGKRWLKPKALLTGLLAVAVAVGAIVVAGKATDGRFGAKLVAIDPGNVQRLRAWSAAPEMMATAPGGWGAEPGRAYCDWFQDVEDTHKLYYLVNSHLTWLVQYGRIFRFAYLAAWMALFLVMLAFAGNRIVKLALCESATFAVALWFSTVGIFPTLWILPGLCVVAAVAAIAYECMRRGAKANFVRLFAATIAGALIGCGTAFALEAVGRRQSEARALPVSFDGKCVKIGRGEAKTAILDDQTVLAGDVIGSLGHTLRGWMAKNSDSGAVIVTDDPSVLPPRIDRLVAAGRGASRYLKFRSAHIADGDFCRAEKTVFLSPQFSPNDVPYTLAQGTDVSFVTGEFAARLTNGNHYDRQWVTVVPGCELYIPEWPSMTLGSTKGGEK